MDLIEKLGFSLLPDCFQSVYTVVALDRGDLFVGSTLTKINLYNSKGSLLHSYLSPAICQPTTALLSLPGGRILAGGFYRNILLLSSSGDRLTLDAEFERNSGDGEEDRGLPSISGLAVLLQHEKSLVLACDASGTLWVWDFHCPSQVLKKISGEFILSALAFPGTSFFATRGGERIKIWDSETFTCTQTLPLPEADDNTDRIPMTLITPLPSPFSLAPDPATLTFVVGFLKKIIVIGGNPNKKNLKIISEKHVLDATCSCLEASPGKILTPFRGKDLSVWELDKKTVPDVFHLLSGDIFRLVRLSTKNILICKRGTWGVLLVNKELWKKFGIWISLGRVDPKSVLHNLPMEIFFNSTKIVFEHPIFSDLQPFT
jgi:hypothetical protein